MINLTGSLEFMITTSCNVFCPNCDRFCNYNIPYNIKINEYEKELKKWSRLIRVSTVTLQGGEPTLHPHLKDLLKITRKYFDKDTTIQLTTNSSLLNKPKNKGLIETLFEVQPVRINTVIHFTEKDIRKRLYQNIRDYIFKDYKWERVQRHKFKCEKVVLEMMDFTTGNSLWIPYGKISNGQLKPYQDNNPDRSYDRCGQQVVSAIFKGRLFKCPRSAILGHFLEKYKLENDEDWNKYYKYTGIDGNNIKELEDFAETKLKQQSEYICGMCPAYELSSPQKDVSFK